MSSDEAIHRSALESCSWTLISSLMVFSALSQTSLNVDKNQKLAINLTVIFEYLHCIVEARVLIVEPQDAVVWLSVNALLLQLGDLVLLVGQDVKFEHFEE